MGWSCVRYDVTKTRKKKSPEIVQLRELISKHLEPLKYFENIISESLKPSDFSDWLIRNFGRYDVTK